MHNPLRPLFTIAASLLLLAAGSVVLTQCAGGKTLIKENNFETLDLGPFVEKDFPYVSTSMDARKLGASFPKDNVSARTLALKLADSSYVCFDTDLLRWTVAWTGDFLPMYLMPQVSYRDYYNKGNKTAEIAGKAKLATGLYPGWSVGAPVFKEIRPALDTIPIWGPVPPEAGHWNGVYVYKNQAVLSYTVGKTEVYELVTSDRFSGETGFQRNFEIGSGGDQLFFTAAEVVKGTDAKVTDRISYLYHGVNKDSVTAVAVIGGEAKTNIVENRYLSVSVPAGAQSRNLAVLVWMGPAGKLPDFEARAGVAKPVAFPSFKKGGPTLWKGSVLTQGKLSADSEDFVIDQVTLPLPNPWKRNVRVADIAFFPDGTAAVVTFSGDIWIVEGIMEDLKKIKWRRFASGLHEPMSIEIRKGEIYVFDRGGIVKPVDLNYPAVARVAGMGCRPGAGT
jgi:hypothetical protein